MSKHTAGPWNIVEDRVPSSLEVFGGGVAIAELWRHADIEKEKADAHLISAAPELLEALESMVLLAEEMFELWDSDQDSKVGKYLLAIAGRLPNYDQRTHELHAAIAKARGEV